MGGANRSFRRGMSLLRVPRVALLFVLTACVHASPLTPAMKAVEEIRGLTFVHDVKNVTIDRADLAAHLRQQMQESVPYSLDDWGHVLRALQLVDVEGKDILPQLLALYDAQVLAFYDPQSHIYYSIKQLPKLPPETAKLADPKLLEETVMVHELTHALQDQRFDLQRREKSLIKDTDAELAYHSVLEGEAVLVMVAHMLKKSNIDLNEVIKDETLSSMITSASQVDQGIDPSTPPYFASLLKFPYLDGLNFVMTAYRRGGWKELDRIHANPPRSTREILHPEEYFGKTFHPETFDPTRPSDAMAVEHLGEFHWRFLVGADNARGWAADHAIVRRDGRVEIETKWDNAEEATRFANAYSAFLKKRGVDAKVTRDGAAVSARYIAK